MNKIQLVILWLSGLLISGILCSTGLQLLYHAAHREDVLETGYPFTLVIGTAWAYIAPIIIIGVLLAISVKGYGK
jgi:hypothetical protein